MAAENQKSTEIAIGIDLGTTFSCVAFVKDGKAKVIPNDLGRKTTPSIVAFSENERFIGDPAKKNMIRNPKNTVFDAKRLIGRRFDDPIVQKDMLYWPFKLVDVNGMPKIEVTYRGEMKQYLAEEISAMVLGKMKEAAEAYLNAPVKNAVITVPAYFNDMQRKATKDAGQIAGLNVSRIINEPTAAAIAYGLSKDTEIAKNILVYDLGGGTFDVSILNIHGNVYEVKATAGDTHLGGEDFDNILMEHFAAEFKRKHKMELKGEKVLRKLRTACEQAKCDLSAVTTTSVEIDVSDDIIFEANLNRDQFELLCDNLFQSTIAVVKSALDDADLDSDDIDTIVLVGGSTRIPKIQKILQDLFKGKEICHQLNPEKAVAYGAAIQAAIVHGGASDEMNRMELKEVTPLSLGLNVGIDEIMYPMIKRNTPIPVSKNELCATKEDDQTEILFQILQGEHRLAKDNFEIGRFKIDGIPAAAASVERATVTFSIDMNGILCVTAKSISNETATGELIVKNVCGSLSENEIKKMTAEAATLRNEDLANQQFQTKRTELEQFCNEIKAEQGEHNKLVLAKCDDVLSWLYECRRPTTKLFIRKKVELSNLAFPPEREEGEEKDVKKKKRKRKY